MVTKNASQVCLTKSLNSYIIVGIELKESIAHIALQTIFYGIWNFLEIVAHNRFAALLMILRDNYLSLD